MKKERVRDKFLQELEKVPIVQVACERCNVSRQTIYRWRREDPKFHDDMASALEEGDDLINDMCESSLLSLIKNKNFQAVKYHMEKRHPKYKKPEIETPADQRLSQEKQKKIIEMMGLQPEDFLEENYDQTLVRIVRYMRKHDL